MTFTSDDHRYMARALVVAEGARYLSMPNPGVGCVLVRDGQVIGEGHTQMAGGPHAEVMAMRNAAALGYSVSGATAYVTLEPCSHHGRTPPCALGLIEAGVARVVAAMEDPFPEVAGRGLALLREAGIQTEVGLLAAGARASLRGFLSRVERGRPWLRLKIAASLDGRVALASGESQWITGPAARADVQRLRARSCAMITGSGTVMHDDPLLTVREVDGEAWGERRQPLRVVLDSRAQMPPTARMFSAPGKTLVVVADAPESHVSRLLSCGAEVVSLPDAHGRIDLGALLDTLGERGINEATVESGARLNGAWLQSGLVDEIMLYQAPVLLGNDAQGLADFSIARLADKLAPRVSDIRQVGQDIRYTLQLGSWT